MNKNHGTGCTCPENKTMWDNCMWDGSRYELDHMPTSVIQCDVCYALTGTDLDHRAHMSWHERVGHLNVGPAA